MKNEEQILNCLMDAREMIDMVRFHPLTESEKSRMMGYADSYLASAIKLLPDKEEVE